jgi:RNA polymerase sigma-B factor
MAGAAVGGEPDDREDRHKLQTSRGGLIVPHRRHTDPRQGPRERRGRRGAYEPFSGFEPGKQGLDTDLAYRAQIWVHSLEAEFLADGDSRAGRTEEVHMTSSATATPKSPAGCGPCEERELFARWRSDGDEQSRETLVRRFMPLARSLARRYDRSSEPFDDLLQVASLGLLKALDRFDPALGHTFPSFAVPTILGEMRRYFRDSGWSVHVPRGAQERALRVRDAQERLANERGRAPTARQLAEYLEVDLEEIIDALQAIQAYEALSLDAPRPGAEEDVMAYGDAMGSEDERFELVELDATISAVLEHIPPRERLILRMRFVEDLTQTEIAARVGISQMQVSRLLRRSLDQLRALTHETKRLPEREKAA